MPWVKLTCGDCGHTADLFEFCRTPVFGELPPGTYQCPSCGRAFERRPAGPGEVFPSGQYIPAKIKLFPVDGRL